MADTSNLTNFLGDIADAIRTKKSTTEEIPAADFDTEILSIETGIDTSDATAVASDILKGKTAYNAEGKVEGTLEFTEGDVKLFSSEDELNEDTPTDHQMAIIYSNEIRSIEPLEHIASYTKAKTLYFPKTIVCSTPVTEDIQFDTNYQADSSGGSSGTQTLTSTEFNVYFHSQSQHIDVSYTSEDGITYTRNTFTCEDEGMDWGDDPIFILDETNDCLILDPTITDTYVWYRMVSEDTDGSLTAILKQFFLTKQYNFESMHVAIPQKDTSLTRTAKNIAIGANYQVSMTHTLGQRSITPFLTAIELLQNYCYNNSITTSLTSIYGGLTKIKSDTEFEVYIGGYKNSSGTSYFTQTVYFFTPKDYTTVTPEDEIYICSGFRSSSYTPFLRAFNINIETSTVTELSLTTDTYTDTSSYSTIYIPTDIDRTAEYTYVYSSSSVRNLSIYTLNSSGTSANYVNMAIRLGFGTSPQYIYAQNQFTVNSASQLLPDQTAFGTIAPVTGDETVYTSMSNDDFINAGTTGNIEDFIERKVYSAKMVPNKLTRYMSAAYSEPFETVVTTSDEFEEYSYTLGDECWNDGGSGAQLSNYMNNQTYFTVARNSDDTSTSKIVCYALVDNKPYAAIIPNSGETYNGGGIFVHNEELYGVLYKSSSYSQPIYVVKLTNGVAPTVLYTIPALTNYYVYPKMYWNGYLYYYYVGRSTSYTSGYLRRINIDTGSIDTLFTIKDVNAISFVLYDNGLEICNDPYSVVSSTMQWARIEADNTYTTKTYTMPDTYYGAITAIFNYNDEKYMACWNKKKIYKVDDTTNTLTNAHTYTTASGYTWHQPDKNGPLYIQFNNKAVTVDEMFEDVGPTYITNSSYILNNSETMMYHDSYTGNNLDYALYPARLLHQVDNTEAADTILSLPVNYSYSMFGNTCDYRVAVLAEPTGTISPAEYDTALETAQDILGKEEPVNE